MNLDSQLSIALLAEVQGLLLYKDCSFLKEEVLSQMGRKSFLRIPGLATSQKNLSCFLALLKDGMTQTNKNYSSTTT